MSIMMVMVVMKWGIFHLINHGIPSQLLHDTYNNGPDVWAIGLNPRRYKHIKPKTGWSNGPLQLNSYPTYPDPTKAMGLSAHTDTSFSLYYIPK
ncbi:uncharacterized protein LOC133038506 [Cannabis sativa]|uniref:uncharacterized protein LOC133038506 n=1 Tax=Cannabis sativa TaxID=3483 RepID=UPI0029CA19F4|nr:uncharacterized protein LOC133038506 [Cannabis sativa]